jgi:hypothetical protein
VCLTAVDSVHVLSGWVFWPCLRLVMNILFINASRHKLCVFLRKNIGWCNLNIDSAIPSMSAQIHNPTKTCKLCQHCYCQLGFSDILDFGTCAKIGMPFV